MDDRRGCGLTPASSRTIVVVGKGRPDPGAVFAAGRTPESVAQPGPRQTCALEPRVWWAGCLLRVGGRGSWAAVCVQTESWRRFRSLQARMVRPGSMPLRWSGQRVFRPAIGVGGVGLGVREG